LDASTLGTAQVNDANPGGIPPVRA